MSPKDFKEASRLFWMVKGHLNAEDHVIMDCYDGYFTRIWYNEEAYVNEEGFEEAWENKYGSKQDKKPERRGPRVLRQITAYGVAQIIPKRLTKVITVN
jgi:hypothetical protein